MSHVLRGRMQRGQVGDAPASEAIDLAPHPGNTRFAKHAPHLVSAVAGSRDAIPGVRSEMRQVHCWFSPAGRIVVCRFPWIFGTAWPRQYQHRPCVHRAGCMWLPGKACFAPRIAPSRCRSISLRVGWSTVTAARNLGMAARPNAPVPMRLWIAANGHSTGTARQSDVLFTGAKDKVAASGLGRGRCHLANPSRHEDGPVVIADLKQRLHGQPAAVVISALLADGYALKVHGFATVVSSRPEQGGCHFRRSCCAVASSDCPEIRSDALDCQPLRRLRRHSAPRGRRSRGLRGWARH
jgi:hypothetical protein